MRFGGQLAAIGQILGLLAGLGEAFRDTTPFVLFSSHGSRDHGRSLLSHDAPSSLSAHTFSSLAQVVSSCDYDVLLFFNQPGLHATDLQQGHTPLLKRYLDGSQDALAVPFGLGDVNIHDLSEQLSDKCHAEHFHFSTACGKHPVFEMRTGPRVMLVDLKQLPTQPNARKQVLLENDMFLHSVLSSLPKQAKYSVVMASDLVDMEDEIKPEAFALNVLDKRDNEDAPNIQQTGLFTRYQYFSPGLWMSYIVLVPIILPSIFIACKAVGSIQVPYGAFEPDRSSKKKNQ